MLSQRNADLMLCLTFTLVKPTTIWDAITGAGKKYFEGRAQEQVNISGQNNIVCTLEILFHFSLSLISQFVKLGITFSTLTLFLQSLGFSLPFQRGFLFRNRNISLFQTLSYWFVHLLLQLHYRSQPLRNVLGCQLPESSSLPPTDYKSPQAQIPSSQPAVLISSFTQTRSI